MSMATKNRPKYYYIHPSARSNVSRSINIAQPSSVLTTETSGCESRCKSVLGFHKEKEQKSSRAQKSKRITKYQDHSDVHNVAQKQLEEDVNEIYNPYEAYSRSTKSDRPKSARPSTRRGSRDDSLRLIDNKEVYVSKTPKCERKLISTSQRPKSARPESRRGSYQYTPNDIKLDFDDLNVDPVKYFMEDEVDSYFVNNCLSANDAFTSSRLASSEKFDAHKPKTYVALSSDCHGNIESKGKHSGKSEQHFKRNRSSSLKYVSTNCCPDQSKDFLMMDTPSFRTRVRSDSDAISVAYNDDQTRKWRKADKTEVNSLQFHEKLYTTAAERVLAKYTKPPPHPVKDGFVNIKKITDSSSSSRLTEIGIVPFPRKLKPIGVQRERSFLEIE